LRNKTGRAKIKEITIQQCNTLSTAQIPYANCYKIKQAVCVLQFVCKHTELKCCLLSNRYYKGLKQQK